MTDYKNDLFSLSNTIYNGLVEFFNQNLINIYPKLKIVKFSAISSYPQIVFKQTRVTSLRYTSRNELRAKSVEFELNIYTTDTTDCNGAIINAKEVLENITNVATIYLEKLFGASNVNATLGLTNFDSKNIQSEKAIIQFVCKWLQDKNIYK